MEENTCLRLYFLSVSVPVTFFRFDVDLGVFICNLMRIGRWSELSVNRVCQEHEVMSDANETSGNFGSAFAELLWGCTS